MECPKSIATLITQCWAADVSDRPSFSQIVKTLEPEEANMNEKYGESEGHDLSDNFILAVKVIEHISTINFVGSC